MNERPLPGRESEDIYVYREKRKDVRETRLQRLRIKDLLKRSERQQRGEPEPEKVDIGKRQLDVFAIMQVLPYIGDGQTMLNLLLTTKKFQIINTRLPKNPFDLVTRRDQLLFEHVDTLVIYTPISLKPIYEQIKERGTMPEVHLERRYTGPEIDEMKKRKTEKDKKIIRDLMLSDERTDVEIDDNNEHMQMSVHDIGEVVAPTFKEFTNLEIQLDFDWIVNYITLGNYDDKEYKTLMNLDRFMIDHDERGYASKIRFVKENEYKDIVIVPEDWKVLPAEVFQEFSFQQIVLSPELFLIGESAMYSCKNLRTIHIPASVQIIRSYAFLGCINLEEVTFENGSELKIVELSVFSATKIKRLVFPDQVEQVGRYCFLTCFELEYVRFPRSIKKIKEPFGSNSNLEIIEIPVEMRAKIEDEESSNKIGRILKKTRVVYY